MASRGNGRRVTLEDIAQATGYSRNAVSRALRNKADIGAETTARIQSVAREMGYVSNYAAASLRNGRSHMIAAIVGDMINPFYGIICDLLQQEAQKSGYSLMIMCSRDDPELELRMVEQALAHNVDGVLLFPSRVGEAAVERLRAAHLPFVLMTRYFQAGRDDCVLFDDAQGAYLATAHLIGAGHRKLAYLSPNQVLLSSAQRQAGFLRACDEAGIPEGDRYICQTESQGFLPVLPRDWQAPLMERLAQIRDEGVTGLFIFCDVEAWHVIDAMQRTGRLDPLEFGIAGFDNIDGQLSSPTSLCSVDCDLAHVSRSGLELLYDRMENPDAPTRTIVCKPTLVCRGSCRRSSPRCFHP